MKKYLIIASSLILAASASAKTLSPAEALNRLDGTSVNITAKSVARADVAPKLLHTGFHENLPTYYVFNHGEENYIVAADDIATPLLGRISDPNFNFDSANPSVRYWLGELSREIAWGIENGITSIEPRTAKADRQDIDPLVKTKWDQTSPYNNLCPSLGFGASATKCPTGCVATAMAQVMNYHKYPEHGNGTFTYYWSNGAQELSIDLENTKFDWANMRNSFSQFQQGTADQRTAVATLMKACGYTAKMDYDKASSGTFSNYVGSALYNQFSYDGTVRDRFRDLYPTEAWEQLIYDELINFGPVIYNGSGSGGGHSFVCDGYDAATNMFHINWGWSGDSDGYFALSALNPESLGTGGGTGGGFNYQQDAVIGIRPPVNGVREPYTAKASLFMLGKYSANVTSSTLRLQVVEDSGGIGNFSEYDGIFNLSIEIKGEDNNSLTRSDVSIRGSKQIDLEVGFYFGSISASASISSLPNGTYLAYFAHRIEGENTWIKTPVNAAYPRAIRFKKLNGTVTLLDNSDLVGGDMTEFDASTSAIDDINIDAPAAAGHAEEYYDLHGRRINPDRAQHGIYIRRTPNATSKVVL